MFNKLHTLINFVETPNFWIRNYLDGRKLCFIQSRQGLYHVIYMVNVYFRRIYTIFVYQKISVDTVKMFIKMNGLK